MRNRRWPQFCRARDEYVLNTSEFDQVKSRLASINNKHKLQNDNTNGNRPTLRRSTADNPTNNPNGNGDAARRRPSDAEADGQLIESSSTSFN